MNATTPQAAQLSSLLPARRAPRSEFGLFRLRVPVALRLGVAGRLEPAGVALLGAGPKGMGASAGFSGDWLCGGSISDFVETSSLLGLIWFDVLQPLQRIKKTGVNLGVRCEP